MIGGSWVGYLVGLGLGSKIAAIAVGTAAGDPVDPAIAALGEFIMSLILFEITETVLEYIVEVKLQDTSEEENLIPSHRYHRGHGTREREELLILCPKV